MILLKLLLHVVEALKLLWLLLIRGACCTQLLLLLHGCVCGPAAAATAVALRCVAWRSGERAALWCGLLLLLEVEASELESCVLLLLVLLRSIAACVIWSAAAANANATHTDHSQRQQCGS